MTNANKATERAQPEAGHAQPINPPAGGLQDAGLKKPASMPQSQASGRGKLSTAQYRLEDVLPEIKALAQKVGGFRKLAEIAEILEQTQE